MKLASVGNKIKSATVLLKSRILSHGRIESKIGLVKFGNGDELYTVAGAELNFQGRFVSHGGSRFSAAEQGASLSFGDGTFVNRNCTFVARDSIVVDAGCMFGPNVIVYDHDHDFTHIDGIQSEHFKYGKVYIGKNCWIGAGTVILRNTYIGENSVIGAGSVLKGSYPENSLIIQRRATEVQQICTNTLV